MYFVYDIGEYIAVFSFALPLLMVFLRPWLWKYCWPIFLLIVFKFLSVGLELVFARVFKNCYPIFHISVFIETFLILLYFIHSGFYRKISLFFLATAVILFYIETFYLEQLFNNNFMMTLFSNVVISLISFLNLYTLFSSKKLDKSYFQFHFFINTGFFIFYVSSFYVSLFESYIRESISLFIIIYPIFWIFLITENILLTKGIWHLQKI
jgi:hypothetical protein